MNTQESPHDVDFPYENLVFRGGGTKTYAYIGALEVLEKRGKLANFKRYAGASGGAIIASLLALGADCKTLKEFSSIPFECITQDAHCTSMPLVRFIPFAYNISQYYGWNSGDKFLEYLQEKVKYLTGNKDTTFNELYINNGKELCVAATNVTKMSLEFFHPKLTPDVPIAMAVRMSMSIPGYFQPVNYHHEGQDCYFVDGGMLCNYPVFCFDGWYLSMEPQDSFLCNLADEKRPPFVPRNDKTLGMVVHSAMEPDVLKEGLDKRYDSHKIPRPDTQLARSRKKEVDRELERIEDHTKKVEAARRVAAAISSTIGKSSTVNHKEFMEVIDMIGKEDLQTLTGGPVDPDKIFEKLDRTGDGKIHSGEFLRVLDVMHISAGEIKEGPRIPADIVNSTSFFHSVFSSIMNTVERYYIKKEDLKRTVGIKTDYITTLDFDLAEKDKEFLLKQAEAAMEAFLEENTN